MIRVSTKSRGLAAALALTLGCGDVGDGDGESADAAAIEPGTDAGSTEPGDGGGPSGAWQWIDVAGAECMNDTPTGMGVRIGADPSKLLIFLEGGGACFNRFTCSGVAHQNGFGADDFAAGIAERGDAGVFNRADPDNPFATWTHVFIPYCTGDIFAGANPDGFEGRNQVGYTNMGHYTDQLVSMFPDVEVVVLSGSSAGGFGAAYNYDRVASAFGDDVEVLLLDDSGPPLGPDYLTPCLQDIVRTTWNLDATLPADCDACRESGGLSALAPFYATKYPDRRFGIITSTRDGVIRLFVGWGYPSCDNPKVPMDEAVFAQGVAQLRDEILAPYDNARVFTIDSGLHVWLLEDPVGSTSSGGVTLTDWIRGLVAGSGDWGDVVP
ncbi:MAG: hypothetical protein D6689_16765 [Deltaproteobacteria bacterium]|nr:MAG: hypothetical protein D6689_16765 [Deltaproteobacteria bacterium]